MLQDLEDLHSSCIPQSESKAEQKRLQNLKLDLIINTNKERSTTEDTNSIFNTDKSQVDDSDDSLRSLSDQAAKFSPVGNKESDLKSKNIKNK